MVAMRFVDDRFETELLLCSANDSQVVCRSKEGEADQPWPSHGPLQEVVKQSGDAGPFLAGVGRCGKSHWSVIIAAISQGNGIEFDFACRVKSDPEWLGSTYQLTSGGTFVTLDSGQIGIEIGDQTVLLAADATSISVSGDDVVQFRASSEKQGLPYTARWKYGFELK